MADPEEQVPKTLDQLSDDDLFYEYQSRKKASADLMEFIQYTKVDFKPSLHHHYLSEKLEGVINGDIKRLIVTMPPRHGKSEMASRRLPAYYLGKHPTREIICATYNSDFAAEFGRNVREIVNTEEYSNVFPEIAIKSTDRAADRWSLTSGGGFRAAGVGGGLTGRGGHLIIIDDPIKSREEADSKLQRDRIWDWYRSVVYTRQAPNCAFIIIQTRWHDDDLAGRLLAEAATEGEQWELINFPALAYGQDALGRKDGEPLWPNWFPVQMLEQVRRTIGPREWSALYQQTPVEDDGSYDSLGIRYAQDALTGAGNGYFNFRSISPRLMAGFTKKGADLYGEPMMRRFREALKKSIGHDSYERVGPKVKEVVANLYGEGVSVKNINNNDWWANRLFAEAYKGMEGRFPEVIEEATTTKEGVSRREFLKAVGAGATGTVFPYSMFKGQNKFTDYMNKYFGNMEDILKLEPKDLYIWWDDIYDGFNPDSLNSLVLNICLDNGVKLPY